MSCFPLDTSVAQSSEASEVLFCLHTPVRCAPFLLAVQASGHVTHMCHTLPRWRLPEARATHQAHPAACARARRRRVLRVARPVRGARFNSTRCLHHLSSFLTTSRMALPQDPSTKSRPPQKVLDGGSTHGCSLSAGACHEMGRSLMAHLVDGLRGRFPGVPVRKPVSQIGNGSPDHTPSLRPEEGVVLVAIHIAYLASLHSCHAFSSRLCAHRLF